MQATATKDQQTALGPPRDDVSLFQIAAVLWRWRLLLGATVIGFALCAGVTAKLLPKKYEATVLVAPVAGQDGLGLGGGLGAMASQLGGLASLAGFSLGGGNDLRAIAIATLESHALTEQFIQERDLLPILFSDDWNAERKRWTSRKTPTLWLGDQYFSRKVRKVTEDRKTGLVSVEVTWTNPVLAAQWANDLVSLTNEKLRNQTIHQSQREIAYLQIEAKKTTVVELQNAIYSLMKSEIEKEMVARGREQYALRVIDPAIVPERRSSPITLLWVLGGAVLGFVVMATVALIKELS